MTGDTDKITHLLETIKVIDIQHETLIRKTGDGFNVFKLCGVDHYENAHSDIIAEFLNPKGSHGCGSDFFQAFCKITGLDFLRYGNAEVIREYWINDGRLDILIRAGENKIAIENKIYAIEQQDQLPRYRKWLDDVSIDKKEAPLLFLTLDGKPSSDETIQGQYTCISYKEHIIPWLTECVRIAAEKPFVRESLLQYKKLVEELTGGSMMTQEETEIIKNIQGNFQAAFAIADSLNKAKAQWFYNNLVEPLLDKKVDVDVEKGKWQQLIRNGRGKEYLDCFISHRKGKIKVVYAYQYNFQDPRREIITYSSPESEDIIDYKTTKGDKMPHAIPDELWGHEDRAKQVVEQILNDIETVFATSQQ